MGITRNGAVEYQPREQMFNDALDMAQWKINSFGSSGDNPRARLAQEYYQNIANKRLTDEQEIRNLEINALKQKMAGGGGGGGGGGGSVSYGRGGVEKGPRGGGMSPHEQQQMQEQASARAAAAEREKLKKQRADDRLHMNNLLFDYEQAKKRNSRPGSSGGSRGNRGDEGYTEQIFNNAGAPEVVRLKNYTPDRGTEAADMQAIMNILMGAR